MAKSGVHVIIHVVRGLRVWIGRVEWFPPNLGHCKTVLEKIFPRSRPRMMQQFDNARLPSIYLICGRNLLREQELASSKVNNI